MTSLIRSHPLIAYFVLTYAFSWLLWIPLQPLVLDGHVILEPLISLGIFAPALVSIGLSALFQSRPRRGRRKTASVAFIVTWIAAAVVIGLDRVVIEGADPSTLLVAVCIVTAMLPAFIVASAFSTIPGIRTHLATLLRPPGAAGYYLVALLLFPAIWILGMLVSRVLGFDVPAFDWATVDVRLWGGMGLFFLMNFIHGGLSEEPGWRGFALPRLQARFSPFTASLILGLLWAVWHAPARFGGIEAKSLEDTIVEWILIVFVTFLFTWLYNRTEGSVLATAILHPSMNTTSRFVPGTLGALLLVVVVMIIAVIQDRMWKRLPAESPTVHPGTG